MFGAHIFCFQDLFRVHGRLVTPPLPLIFDRYCRTRQPEFMRNLLVSHMHQSSVTDHLHSTVYSFHSNACLRGSRVSPQHSSNISHPQFSLQTPTPTPTPSRTTRTRTKNKNMIKNSNNKSNSSNRNHHHNHQGLRQQPATTEHLHAQTRNSCKGASTCTASKNMKESPHARHTQTAVVHQ